MGKDIGCHIYVTNDNIIEGQIDVTFEVNSDKLMGFGVPGELSLLVEHLILHMGGTSIIIFGVFTDRSSNT